ncbi:hypothetical protein VMCG_02450 [Cytospora schulzeri]|uniref:G-patch domain-containing protein n=1 Tax=Cytospora schulzeri TaxID=448051 RepID=A0A423X1V5_9PEZI|nr:hypothetical protein VMCG_02450 [Valsa malicola]
MSGDEFDELDDDIPLQHRKPFGSGLRRNEIKFVPASSGDPKVTKQAGGKPHGQSVSDFYLNMVLKKPDPAVPQQANEVEEKKTIEVCEVCQIPLTGASRTNASSSSSTTSHHEASIAHQVCLAHSHPPSALDRGRMGLSVLESQGWDPDSRAGLGAAGQGVQHPIKVKPKAGNLGIGVVVPKDFRVKEKEKPKLLGAKKVRKMAAEDRKRADKLQRQIFGRADLERYLGDGA